MIITLPLRLTIVKVLDRAQPHVVKDKDLSCPSVERHDQQGPQKGVPLLIAMPHTGLGRRLPYLAAVVKTTDLPALSP